MPAIPEPLEDFSFLVDWGGTRIGMLRVSPLRWTTSVVSHREGSNALVVAPRFPYSLMNARPAPPLGAVWGSASIVLPETARRPLKNAFTGETVTPEADGSLLLRDLLARFPVALLSDV